MAPSRQADNGNVFLLFEDLASYVFMVCIAPGGGAAVGGSLRSSLSGASPTSHSQGHGRPCLPITNRPAKTFYIVPNASETAVLFCENVLGGTKKRLSIPSSPAVSLDIPRILHLLQNICGFQANSLVGYPRPRLGIVLRARLSEKSNIPQRESGIRFRPLHGQNLPILYNFVRKNRPFPGQK